ncbi:MULTISPECIES: hypothetical protein [Amycolatopsis]|uniref:DUF5709 domain-containing protein n=1 Tax=Amycolatopsis thermalba TaxID=944492 RepID=A0ABY4P311_9PSEU|nr:MULTISPECIES: hypothetical protein [Amycolatopsis]OXM71035.1 hypothetical protein CF166_20100 [Amycolatopsis sp. KNN50.9b]UQS26739.1 hypothetical protein L1857_30005 [Amycolatopsis thermalba]
MSEAHGHPVPDAVESDPAALNSAEDLDEDRLRVDPLEEGVEPPERYMASDRFGTTPNEVREGESLDGRLAQERPDVQPEDVPADETGVRAEAPDPGQNLGDAVDQKADNPPGSVPDAIRTPPDEDPV